MSTSTVRAFTSLYVGSAIKHLQRQVITWVFVWIEVAGTAVAGRTGQSGGYVATTPLHPDHPRLQPERSVDLLLPNEAYISILSELQSHRHAPLSTLSQLFEFGNQ